MVMSSIPEDARIGRVALTVTDIERMTTFYESVVGLEVLSTGDGRAVLGVDGAALLVLIENHDAEPRPRDAAGLFHTAFRVPSREALGDALRRVESQWELDGAADHIVSEALYFSDPEGNGIEVYCDRPRTEWEETEDGMVKMATLQADLAGIREQAAGDEQMSDGTTVGHVHLEVSDLSAARRFYVDALGMNVRQDLGSALFVAAGGYHHHIGLNTWNNRASSTSGRGLTWFEVTFPDGDALEAVRDRCEDRGIAVESVDGGYELVDPDGIVVRLQVAPQ